MEKEINIPMITPMSDKEYLVSVFRFGTPQTLAIGVSYDEAVRIQQEEIERQKEKNKKNQSAKATD